MTDTSLASILVIEMLNTFIHLSDNKWKICSHHKDFEQPNLKKTIEQQFSDYFD